MTLPSVNAVAMIMASLGVLFLMIGATYLRAAGEKSKTLGMIIHVIVAMVFLVAGVYILSIYGLAAIS